MSVWEDSQKGHYGEVYSSWFTQVRVYCARLIQTRDWEGRDNTAYDGRNLFVLYRPCLPLLVLNIHQLAHVLSIASFIMVPFSLSVTAQCSA